MSFVSKVFHKIPKPLRSKKAIAILIVLIIIWNVLTGGSGDQGKITTEKVKKGDVTAEVIASGRVSSPMSATLRFAVPGKIVYVPVTEGESVKKGQVIASLDRERYDIALRQADWTFKAAKAEFDKVADDLKNNTDETYDERIRRTAVDATHNNAYEALLAARRNLRDVVLTSPIDGTLTTLDAAVGEEASITNVAAEIADLTTLQFTADIDETDIAKVSDNQAVTIILDAYPDDTIKSTITKIGLTSTTTTTGATAYQMDFSLPQSARYRLGMNGEVTIVTEQDDDTLLVPLEALVDDNYVYLKENGVFRKQKVKVGILSDAHFQALSGVKLDDMVLTGGFEEIEKRSLLDKILGK